MKRLLYLYLIHEPRGGAWQRQKEIFFYQLNKGINTFLICFKSNESIIVKNQYPNNVLLIPNYFGIKSGIIYKLFSLFLFIYLSVKYYKLKLYVISFEGHAGLLFSIINRFYPRMTFVTFLRGTEKLKMARSSMLARAINNLFIRLMIKNASIIIFQSNNGLKTVLKDFINIKRPFRKDHGKYKKKSS